MAKQDKKELDEIKSLLQDIERLYTKIGMANPFSGKEAKDFLGNISKLKDELDTANDILHDMDGGIGDIVNSWKALTDEVKSHYNSISRSKSSLSSLTSIAEKLKNHQKGIASLSAKELKSLQEQYKVQTESLKINQKALEQTINALSSKNDLTREELKQLTQSQSIYNTINGLLSENDSVHKLTKQKLEDEVKLTEDIEKNMGLTGAVVEGFGKSLDKLGFGSLSSRLGLDKAQEKMREMAKSQSIQQKLQEEINKSNKKNLSISQIKAGFGGKELKNRQLELDNLIQQNGQLSGMSGKAKILGTGFKQIGSNLMSSFKGGGGVLILAQQMIEALIKTDNAAGDLAKNMNLTYDGALDVRRELGEMAAMSMDPALNTRALQETLVAVGNQLGSNAKLNESDLKTFTKLREQAGYTNEELYGIQQLSLVNNKTLEDNTKEILGSARAYASQNKLVINEKQVLKDISKTSAAIKLSLGGSAKAIAESIVKARQFGVSLEQAEKISQSLLNFESSIENELSAELLLGKDLSLEKARQLALNNDIAGATEEIAKQVGTSADFANMNAIQQEAIAKAAGMTRDELAQSLMNREALAKLSGVEGATAQERFNNLVKEVGMEEAKKRLGDEQLANQYQQQSVQERFNQTVEKLQEVFVQLAEPILAIVSPLMDLVSSILPAINILMRPMIGAFKLVADIVAGIIKALSFDFQGALGAFSKVPGDMAKSFYFDIPFNLSKGNDVLSQGDGSSGYGKRTLFGPEGAIQLNNKDTIIAGTDLFKKSDDMISSPKGTVTVSNSTAAKKETSIDPNAGTNARLDALISMTGKVNAIPTLKIQ